MKIEGENGVIAHFILDCQVKNRTRYTLIAYQRALALLTLLLSRLCGLSDLEEVMVLHLRQCVKYLLETPWEEYNTATNQHMAGKTLSVRSVRDYVLVWKAFFNWCYQEELIEKNPVTRLKTPTPPKKIKPTLTRDELQMMLDLCDRRTDQGFRDFVILSLLADTGIRLAEIAGLEVKDIHTNYIKVYGKGQKEREVGLHPEVGKLLWKYIHKHRHPKEANETSVFVGRWGHALKESAIHAIVERIKLQCGLENKQVSPHTFRHTFSKQYMERGGDLLSLSRELGHSDIQVTRLYLQDFGSTEARKDHNKRSIFNDIRIQKRQKPKEPKKD
jgi:integrase/recombinase XerD